VGCVVSRKFIEELPKAELHVHLEGTLDAAVLAELAPGPHPPYQFRDFAGFLENFKRAVAYLRSAEDYALVTRRLIEKLAAQNVRYAEITLAAGVVLWKKLDFSGVYEAVARECARAPFPAWLIVDAVRQFGVEHVWQVARLAVERAGGRIVAFGIGGDEAAAPAGQFAEVFRFVRERGLRLIPHAGETAGAESVAECLRMGAFRIGHGIRAADDPAVVGELRDRRIPLEVCLSSNIATGAASRWEEHPVRRLYDAGVPITLHTDDPAIFATTLNGEYEIAASRYGFTEEELSGIAENSFRFACRP
jgi:adenosine deaminase/aminodeoxyfutalosine deaminase